MAEVATPDQKFDEALRFADQTREKILAALEGVSQSDSERKPTPEAWSIGEIAHHLLLAEIRFPDQILNSIVDGREGEFDKEEVLSKRPFSLEDIASVEKSGKGKTPEPIQPSHGLSIKGLLEELRQAREEARSKLLPHRSRELGNLWWRHSRLGPLTLYERMYFLGYHDLKHLTQIENRLSNRGG
ncbi:DinB family protein [Acidobacteria bacterium AH-259-D05]|nr:DinB family protein [Acidobacteria bacterium AH-259-D05]